MGISGIRYFVAALLVSVLMVSVAYAAGLAITVQRVDSSEYPKIRVYVNVATEQGMTITGLEAQGFQLLEDEKPVEGLRVEPLIDSQEPIAVALDMDVSGSMNDEGKLDAAKQAAAAFMDTMGQKDTVSITTFSDAVQMVQGYTGDKGALKNAVDQLAAKGETSLYDSVVQSAQLMGALPIQRKVIIVLTDGEDTKSKQSVEAAIDAARQAGAAVLAVGLGEGVKRDVLDKLAGETGGQAYYVGTGELRNLFISFSDQLRRHYVLTYNTQLPADGKQHNIVVKAEDRGRTGEGRGSFSASPKPLVLEVKGITNASQVSGTLTIQATVSGGTAQQVELLVDDKSKGTATGQPFGFQWDTSKETAGMHKVVVRAKDTAGATVEQTFAVSVAAPAGATTGAVAPVGTAGAATAVPTKTGAAAPPKDETNPIVYYAVAGVVLLLALIAGLFFFLRGRKLKIPELEKEKEDEAVSDRTEVVKFPVDGWPPVAPKAAAPAPPPPAPAPQPAAYAPPVQQAPPIPPRPQPAAYTPPVPAPSYQPPQPAYSPPPPRPAAPPPSDVGATVMAHMPDPGATVVGSSVGGETVVAARIKPKLPTARLQIVFGSTERVELISEGESTIGRQASNRIVLADPGASRWHAKITLQDGEFWIEDMKSANGTLVNDQPITRQQLVSHDRIQISDTVITYTKE